MEIMVTGMAGAMMRSVIRSVGSFHRLRNSCGKFYLDSSAVNLILYSLPGSHQLPRAGLWRSNTATSSAGHKTTPLSGHSENGLSGHHPFLGDAESVELDEIGYFPIYSTSTTTAGDFIAFPSPLHLLL